jgi:HAD superfamily hydrolase (TIGR01509 family)
MFTLKALIFDVDGTLADTEEVHRRAFNMAFREVGLEWDWSPALYAKLLVISGGRERIHHYAKLHGTGRLQPTDLVEFVHDLHHRKAVHYREFLKEAGLPLRTGVRRLLEEARSRKIQLAVATSSSLSNLRTLLDQHLPPDWPSWFEVIATSDVVREKKPSPAVYHYVLQHMGLFPEECIAIEDTFNGHRAALAAGIKTIITVHGFTRHHDFTGALLVLDGLGEPDHPFQVFAGNPRGNTFVNIEWLQAQTAHRAAAVKGPMRALTI